MTFDTAGRSMMGVSPDDFANFAGKLRINGFGANCGIGPAELLHSVDFKDIVGTLLPKEIVEYHGILMVKFITMALQN